MVFGFYCKDILNMNWTENSWLETVNVNKIKVAISGSNFKKIRLVVFEFAFDNFCMSKGGLGSAFKLKELIHLLLGKAFVY